MILSEMLDFNAANWVLSNATLVGSVLTIGIGGTATFAITTRQVKEVPDALAFVGTCVPPVDPSNPKVYGLFKATYATADEQFAPRSGVSITLPVGQDKEYVTVQEQGMYTECSFTIHNKTGQAISLSAFNLFRSRIQHPLYTDEDGLVNNGSFIYVIEMGHTLDGGDFYFNRSYTDEPYYTMPNNPGATVEPITNAAGRFVGGTVVGASVGKALVVCYCALSGGDM